jgi:hypothetical protein
VTAPVPEEDNAAYDVDDKPPGEHEDDLPGKGDADRSAEATREENAGTSLDQPSQ